MERFEARSSEEGARDPFRRPGPIPGTLGGRVLTFVFLAVAEYLAAPPLLGVNNFAGVWSTIGVVLFAALLLSTAVFVLRPLMPVLESIFASPADRRTFLVLAAGGFVIGLFATSSLQIVAGGSTAAGPLGYSGSWTTVYSPFGAWSSFGFALASLHLAGAIDPQVFVLLGVLSVLWGTTVTLEVRRSRACATPRNARADWRTRLGALAVWAPSGFMTGCANCAPLAMTALGLVVPGVASSGYSAEPLVPWIGVAGLLYLASLGLALMLLRRATRPDPPESLEEGEGEAGP